MPPGKPPTPNPMSSAGGGKPKPTEKVGDKAYQEESSLTGSPNTQGSGDEPGKPQESDKETTAGKKTGDKVKDLAASASETASDIKDVAKAGPTGLETSAQEIKQGADKGGKKGAAAAAGREATGQAVATGVDVLTAGATTEAHGKIAKGVSKGLKKENLTKIAIAFGVIIGIPAILVGIIVGVLLYAASDPYKFLQQVVTDPKTREFAVQAAALTGKTIANQDDLLKQYGYVDVTNGTAIAQSGSPTPKPGSLEDKITKINLKNATYQTNSKPSCPYTFTYKDKVGPNGQQTSVIDKVFDSKGREVNADNFIVNYCIAQSMPLYNLMVRVDKGQEVNSFGDVVLNYAANPESLKDKSKEEIDKYVYDKTYNRITSSSDDDPKIDNENVTEYITNVRKALEDNEDPYAVDSNFQFKPGFDTEDKKTVSTMCTFAQGYLDPENLRKGILTRLNSGQRSGVKSNTLSSTRELGLMSNEELSSTLKQVENWTASRAYFQNVYGTQGGEAINPESLSNTSYGAGYQFAIAILSDTAEQCDGLDNGNLLTNFIGLFGGDNPENTAKLDAIKRDYEVLKRVIISQSNGKFNNPNDFGLQQLMVGMIRMGGGSAVSGLEPGPWNFNNQSQGFRGLSNQYMMRMGGRFLTEEEMTKLNKLAENTRRDVEEKNGIAYRLFAEDNIRSVANIFKYESPKTPNEASRVGHEYIAKLTNPVKIIADIHSSFSYIATGKINRAYAANAIGDAYMRLTTIGLPPEMFNGIDVINNSNEIQTMLESGTPEQKKLLGYFDKCAKSNIPSPDLFSKRAPLDENTGKPNFGSIEIDGLGYPYYPAMADKFEYPRGGEFGISNHDGQPLKEEKREFMACEIYLLPNHVINSGKFVELFGVADVENLATKYHLYLYSNSMADLMVELSNTEESNNIYANPPDGSSNTTTPEGPVDPGQDTSSFPTPAGTTEVPGSPFQDFGPGKVPTVKIKVVKIDGYNIQVNASIGAQVKQLLDAASGDGITFGGGGFRSYEEQERLRVANGCPDVNTSPASSCRVPTAIPGNSMHEVGLAIDFSQNGSTIGSNSTGFAWLKQNAERFGLKNLPSEPWHWSTNGS